MVTTPPRQPKLREVVEPLQDTLRQSDAKERTAGDQHALAQRQKWLATEEVDRLEQQGRTLRNGITQAKYDLWRAESDDEFAERRFGRDYRLGISGLRSSIENDERELRRVDLALLVASNQRDAADAREEAAAAKIKNVRTKRAKADEAIRQAASSNSRSGRKK